jgi:hypothetical protein
MCGAIPPLPRKSAWCDAYLSARYNFSLPFPDKIIQLHTIQLNSILTIKSSYGSKKISMYAEVPLRVEVAVETSPHVRGTTITSAFAIRVTHLQRTNEGIRY